MLQIFHPTHPYYAKSFVKKSVCYLKELCIVSLAFFNLTAVELHFCSFTKSANKLFFCLVDIMINADFFFLHAACLALPSECHH